MLCIMCNAFKLKSVFYWMSKASVTHSLDANYKQKLSDFFFVFKLILKQGVVI